MRIPDFAALHPGYTTARLIYCAAASCGGAARLNKMRW
jgi:hypothetical protein